MKNRRDFLKTLLGVALVAPVIAACRTVVPEPIVLPAAVEPETMFAHMNDSPVPWGHFKGAPIFPDEQFSAQAFVDAYNGPPPSGERVEHYSDGTMAYFDGTSPEPKWRRKAV